MNVVGDTGPADTNMGDTNPMMGTVLIGGTVSGLQGTVSLALNGGTPLAVNSNGMFSFPANESIMTGAMYTVTITGQPTFPPSTEVCTLTNAMGTAGMVNVTNVTVTCVPTTFTVGVTITGLTAPSSFKTTAVTT